MSLSFFLQKTAPFACEYNYKAGLFLRSSYGFLCGKSSSSQLLGIWLTRNPPKSIHILVGIVAAGNIFVRSLERAATISPGWNDDLFQKLRSKLFESFLTRRELKESHEKLSALKFARLTEGFSPRDLRKAATEMEVKFLSNCFPGIFN